MTRPCRLIEVSGAPFERGRLYGAAAEPEIRAGIDHYAAQMRKLDLAEADLEAVVEAYTPHIEAFDGAYVEEMRGIARGSGAAFAHIVMLNARTEILKLAADRTRRETLLQGMEPDGCTAIVALPTATADGTLIHGHNWDWKADCATTSVVLRIRREDGPDILAFTEAGALARFGFNSAGIAITANYLECDRDYLRLGVPLALIRRKVLEQSHLALALRSAWVTPKSGSNNIVISHCGGALAFDLECAPDETFDFEPTDGLIVHANHWQSQAARAKLRETGIAAMPDSLSRERRARALLSPKIGQLTVEDIKGVLLDGWDSPWSICRPPRPSEASDVSATVVTLVMQPQAGLMEMAVLPAIDPTFTSYRLEMEGGEPGPPRVLAPAAAV